MASKKKSHSGKTAQPGKGDGGDADGTNFSPAAIREFIREVRIEFNKVVWPDRKVTVGLTGFVLLLVFVIAIYLGSVDLLLGKLVTMVLR